MSVIELAIGPGPGGYRVDVVRSPDGGEASALVSLDVGLLLARREELQDAVLASSVPTRRLLDKHEQCVREVGQALFTTLLGVGEVAGRYRAAAAVAAERGEGLRVVLRIDDPALAGLPWEAMYDKEVGTYVCRRDQLVRHVGVAAAAAPLAVNAPLRVLGIAASPRELYSLDAAKEKDHLTKALAGNSSVKLTWAPSATWAGLQEVLLSGTWHVIHFIGHGDFDLDRDEGVLALMSEDGRKDLVEASRVVDLLRQAHPVPRLVVLNSCSGAATGITDLFSGTAAALVRGGVTAVAAMQYEITDLAAIAFARGFYGAIAHDRGVDEAVSSGRVAIIGLSGKTLEWVTPVLYLRGHDSHLFAVAAPRPAAHAKTQTAADGGSRQAEPREAAQAAGKPGPGRVHAHVPERLVGTLKPRRMARTLLRAVEGPLWIVAFSPDGALVAAAGTRGTVWLWETGSGTQVRALSTPGSVFGVAFSPDGTVLATASTDGIIQLRETVAWTKAGTMPARTLTRRLVDRVDRNSFLRPGRRIRLAFSPDGEFLASAGDDGIIRLWEIAGRTQVRTFTGHTSAVRGAAFSPDGALLASASSDMTVRLWETATGTQVRTLAGHNRPVDIIAFSPDGVLLAFASAGSDGTIWVCEMATETLLRTLTGHTGSVHGVAFSPDGEFLASAGSDGTIRVWETATGTSLRTLTGHADGVFGVAFSPDGTFLASTGLDGTLRLWQ
jgi:WD40 repeat protein